MSGINDRADTDRVHFQLSVPGANGQHVTLTLFSKHVQPNESLPAIRIPYLEVETSQDNTGMGDGAAPTFQMFDVETLHHAVTAAVELMQAVAGAEQSRIEHGG